MEPQTRTTLGRFLAFIISLIDQRGQIFIEGMEPSYSKVCKYKITDPINGLDFLKLKGLTSSGFAKHIEHRLAEGVDKDNTTFPFPYLFFGEYINPGSYDLETYGYIPRTLQPHLFYLSGSPQFDFSRLIFKGDAVRRYCGCKIFDTVIPPDMLVKHDELLAVSNEILENILSMQPNLMEVAKHRESLDIRAIDTDALLVVIKQVGKPELLPFFKRVKEIFQAAFKAKMKVAKKEKVEYRIKRAEFLHILKEEFPAIPERTFIIFWGLLAPEYKFDGRPEDK